MKHFGIILLFATIFAFDLEEQCREFRFGLKRCLTAEILHEPFSRALDADLEQIGFIVELQALLLNIWIENPYNKLEKTTDFSSVIDISVASSLGQTMRIVYLTVKLYELLAKKRFDLKQAILQTLSRSSTKVTQFKGKYRTGFIGNELANVIANQTGLAPSSLESIFLHWNLNLLLVQIIDPNSSEKHLKFIKLELKDTLVGNIALIWYDFALKPEVKRLLKEAIIQMNYFFTPIIPDLFEQRIQLFKIMQAKYINELNK
jgi:hypothetical protein